MAIDLEGIDLTELKFQNADLFTVDVYAESQTAAAGNAIVYERPRVNSAVTLIGGADWGWLTYGVMKQIRALAQVIGATYTLNYEGTVYTVRFRTEDIPVIDGTPIFDRANLSDSDYVSNVIIKLMIL